MKKSKLIVRLLGGIGNQLFIYANTKALALKNNAELIIDIKSGFENDYKHKRQCELYHFNLKMNKRSLFDFSNSIYPIKP